jgi:hypothetical protein
LITEVEDKKKELNVLLTLQCKYWTIMDTGEMRTQAVKDFIREHEALFLVFTKRQKRNGER